MVNMKVKEVIQELEKMNPENKVYLRDLTTGKQSEVEKVRLTGGQY